jgi:hypothetical protein
MYEQSVEEEGRYRELIARLDGIQHDSQPVFVKRDSSSSFPADDLDAQKVLNDLQSPQ